MSDTQGYSTVSSAEVARRCSPAIAKIARGEGYIAGQRSLFACSHVLNGAGAFACADHPAGGLRCMTCMGSHIERHSDEAELTCDSCLLVFESLVPLACISQFERVRIREPRGRSRLFSGLISFIGVGACSGCWGAG